ncbi:MAG: EMC3/TMCO1 family protein [Candidatus Freyarchaeum deiterrae]
MSIQAPPESMWVILGVSVAIGAITGAVNRLVLPVAKIRRYSREIRKYRQAMADAKKENNQKLILKLERKQKFIERITREQGTVRLRPTLLFMIPFWIIFAYLNSLYSTSGIAYVTAVLPINLNSLSFIPSGMMGALVGPGYINFNWLMWQAGILVYLPQIFASTISSYVNTLLGLPTIAWSSIPGFGLWFIWWYFICNLAFQSIFMRLFGVNFET